VPQLTVTAEFDACQAEITGGTTVDSDRIEGSVKEGAGKVKEEWGDATDNPSTELEGKQDQAEGKIQQGWGEAKDAVRDAADDADDD
jgi:uncharacterized protein YjbJ (UPF0337 family)